MRIGIRPGGGLGGEITVPGDKSIAHRWLILAALAGGRSELRGLSGSLDVVATARVLAAVCPPDLDPLEAWAARSEVEGQADGGVPAGSKVSVEGSGRAALREAPGPLDCANSGTTMRLMAGVLAAARFRSVLTGDDSLLRRPMERVAEPLRAMGASIETTAGCPPLTVEGGRLHGVDWKTTVPSAQVKGATLLAALEAEGASTVTEPAPTRDHTERALQALGAPVSMDGLTVRVESYRHGGFDGEVPGDVSSAAFLLCGAALSGSALAVTAVGTNPTRTRFLDVLRRMGLDVRVEEVGTSVGEPYGSVEVAAGASLAGTRVAADELPLIIDEVPALALLAAHADGETRFEGAAELRVKESDRLGGLVDGIRGLGGDAVVDGDTLVVAGGGLRGGRADARGDHRLAMALAIGALGASGPSEVEGIESAAVSFPGFVEAIRGLGATGEVEG